MTIISIDKKIYAVPRKCILIEQINRVYLVNLKMNISNVTSNILQHICECCFNEFWGFSQDGSLYLFCCCGLPLLYDVTRMWNRMISQLNVVVDSSYID